ncbi:MAG: hypothetical protein JO132_06100 [Streptosporangiaceae bacterium]|nr:hypothetical protein [Streptosporangiaceae bacterium]
MNTLEDQVREALAERASLSPVDPDAWDKTVARSRGRRLRRLGWQRPARAGLLVPAVAAAAVAAVILASAALAGHAGPGPNSPRPAGASPSGPPPPRDISLATRQIPPVTPFVPVSLFADGHQVRDFLWFGYVPGYAAAGIALCQWNDGGVYNEYYACTAGDLPGGALARYAGTDGSGWIRLGVAARQVTSVTALLPGGQARQGAVTAVRGVPYKVWAVSYPVTPAARVVFRDAAGHEVTSLDVPGEQPTPSRPAGGGIPLFRYGTDMVTAYRISGDRIGFWWGGNSTWSDVPVSQSALSLFFTPGPRPLPDKWFGYAPSGTARVALRLADGRQFASRTIPGWPGSGVVFWGPVTLPPGTAVTYDTVVVTYDAAGHVLREVPLVFIG